jgi:proteasome lid subunit RPN8/RPN11
LSNSTHPVLRSLRISPQIIDEMQDHMRSWLPNEGCGLLGGHIDAEGTGVAVRFYPGNNVLHSPHRYQMAGLEVVDIFRQIREAELCLLAIVHSHPATLSRPSHVDLAELKHPEAAMVIFSFLSDEPTVAAWLAASGNEEPFHEIPIARYPT